MNYIQTDKVEIILSVIAEANNIDLNNIIKLVRLHSYNSVNSMCAKKVKVVSSGRGYIFDDICVCPSCKSIVLYKGDYCSNCGAKFIKEEG